MNSTQLILTIALVLSLPQITQAMNTPEKAPALQSENASMQPAGSSKNEPAPAEGSKPAQAPSPAADYDISNLDATADAAEQEVNDPIEPFNRAVYGFNRGLDHLIIRPVAIMYRDLTPSWGKDRVHSAINNMGEPVTVANAIMQMDENLVSDSIGRFITNTVLGFGGLIDVAAEADPALSLKKTDFGLTLKKYGVGTGPYLMLPILGPSSVRDAPALAVDYFLDPFNCPELFDTDFIWARTGVIGLDKRYNYLELTDHVEKTSLDEYSTYRSVYFQKR